MADLTPGVNVTPMKPNKPWEAQHLSNDRTNSLVLACLMKEPKTFGELFRETGIRYKKLLAIHLNALKKDGKVNKTYDPEDGKLRWYVIKSVSRPYLEKLDKFVVDWHLAIRGSLDKGCLDRAEQAEEWTPGPGAITPSAEAVSRHRRNRP
jgi:DNA-binding HxlR family transcriptional regulator